MKKGEGYKILASEIVISAINDFRKAAKIIKSKKGNVDVARKEIESIVTFIQSEWFFILTNYDQKILLEKLMEELDDG